MKIQEGELLKKYKKKTKKNIIIATTACKYAHPKTPPSNKDKDMDEDDNYRANDNGNTIDNGNDNDINNYKGIDEVHEDQIQDQEKLLNFKFIT